MKGGKRIMPYATLSIKTNDGYIDSHWGNVTQYNSRIETLKNDFKVSNTKFGRIDITPVYAMIEVEAFWEGKCLFEDKFSTIMKLACIWYYNNSFTIITRPSKGTIIEPYHGRMPIVLEKPEVFLSKGEIIQIDYKQRLKIAS